MVSHPGKAFWPAEMVSGGVIGFVRPFEGEEGSSEGVDPVVAVVPVVSRLWGGWSWDLASTMWDVQKLFVPRGTPWSR
jgi:hypothetical protein